MSGRLPRLVAGELDETQAELYAAIAGGERSVGVQHFPLTDDDGSLHGPFGIMLHAPQIGSALERLGRTVRFQTHLTDRSREIAILQVAQSTGSQFEWWAHTRVGKAAGITDDELTALAVGAFQSSDALETAVTELCARLLTSGVVPDDQFASMSRVLTAEQVIEVTVLVGYYRTLAQLMAVFDVGVPAGEQRLTDTDDGEHGHHAH